MKQLITYLKPYRGPAVLVLVLLLIQALAELYLPNLMAVIIDEGVVFGDTDLIMRVGGVMLLVAAAATAVSIGGGYLAARVAAGFGRDLRREVFRRVTDFSLQEFNQFGTSTLITRTTNDITQVQQVVFMMLRMMLMAPLMAVGGIIMAVSKDAVLSLVLLVAIPILAVIVALIIRKGLPLFEALQDKLDNLNQVVREGLAGIRVIRAFDRTRFEGERFRRANRDLADLAITVQKLMAAMMPIMMLLLNLTIVAVMWFGGVRIDGGRMMVGDLMAFIQYVMRIMFSLLMLTMMFVLIPRAQVSAQRINAVLETVPAIGDGRRTRERAAPSASPSAGGPSSEPREDAAFGDIPAGEVEFQGVSFSYPGAPKPVLQDISFRARPGQVTAIIGSIGSGKTTLLNLIQRQYDVTGGRVLVGGMDVREWVLAHLRNQIGLVPQRAVLFTGTAAENIRYGKEDASMDEVIKAARTARAHDFISEMDGGYDAVIEQAGVNLSGGQKQRLTIARALVRRPPIYIFDDNFSALDYKTDAQVRAALKEETAGATIIMVAQRISTIADADQIIVLDEGRIAGIGTHHELLASNPVYREIAASQMAEEVTA